MKIKYLILFVLGLATYSCFDEASFNSGSKQTKTIDLNDFSDIEVENSFEIELVSDTINKILVTCGENLQSYIKINITNNVLHLNHDIRNNWTRKYEKVKLELHSKPFSRINVRKPARIFNNDIYKGSSFAIVDFGKYTDLDMTVDVDYCLIAMSSDNFGQFKVKGNATQAQIWGWGSCKVQADSLVTANCYVLHRGMGSVFVNATDQLDVSLEFSGNIYYSGNPAQIIIEHRLGTGNLIKK